MGAIQSVVNRTIGTVSGVKYHYARQKWICIED